MAASKHTISSRQWLGLFALSVLLIAAALAAFNVITDPFGAFGDRFCTWWSYDETNNPRVAKFSYLEQHHDLYDSYIIGCSATSSYPTEQLNDYFDASFYNMIMYGADMLDVEQLSRYLVENYTVKNLVLSVYLDNGMTYNDESDPLTRSMPWQVSDLSRLEYLHRFLFANPAYGWDKLQKLRTDEYLQQPYDVFNEQTGAYDKSVRDVEPIGALEPYLEAYPVFTNYDTSPHSLPQIENCMKSVAAIRDLCEAAGVNLVVVSAPVYYDYLTTFPPEQVTEFYTALAEVTPYWDFSTSSVSREPRYYYDGTHFRNAVGVMALARIFDDESVYVPEDFGVYVTPENVAAYTTGFWSVPEPDVASYTAEVPILMYHHLAETGDGGDTIAVANFEAQIAALAAAGYTAVSFEDLYAYVYTDASLPEKPVVITFDDGYESNRTLAMPILERYGMQGTVFVIGVSVGKDIYKDTGVAMTPHFSMDEAATMEASGVMEIYSHGYNIHEVAGRDPEPIRQGILQRADESETEYIAFLQNDCAQMNTMLTEALGHGASVVAYPFGYHTTLSEVLLSQAGVWATVTVEPGMNTLVRGLPQSLRALRRYTATDEYSGDDLVALLEQG